MQKTIGNMSDSHSLTVTTIATNAVLDGVKIIGASLLLAVASQVSFILPYTPVLVTLQTAALLMIGYSLGPVKGSLSVLLYLAEGAIGLPVFAFGQGSLAVLLGPKGGYYAGFVLTAFISGFVKKEQSLPVIFSIFFTAITATFITGLSWLSLYVGSAQMLALGLYPFVIGDLLKICAATAFVKGLKSLN